MNDKKRILDMIEAGTITATEGMALLEAMNETVEAPAVETVAVPKSMKKKTYNFLKIRVIADNEETKVNINIPLKLVKSMSGVANNIEGFIPADAKDAINDQGINLSSFNLDEIIEAIEEGSTDGTLVDIDVDENGERTKVLIYVD